MAAQLIVTVGHRVADVRGPDLKAEAEASALRRPYVANEDGSATKDTGPRTRNGRGTKHGPRTRADGPSTKLERVVQIAYDDRNRPAHSVGIRTVDARPPGNVAEAHDRAVGQYGKRTSGVRLH